MKSHATTKDFLVWNAWVFLMVLYLDSAVYFKDDGLFCLDGAKLIFLKFCKIVSTMNLHINHIKHPNCKRLERSLYTEYS